MLIPAGSRPDAPTALGNHEARIRALERQPSGAAAINRPVGVYKNELSLPITDSTGVTQLGIEMDTVQTNGQINADGVPYFAIDPIDGAVIKPGFYSLACWLTFDNPIDWSTAADPFYASFGVAVAPIGGGVGGGVEAFGLLDIHVITTDGPALWQLKNYGYWNVHVHARINLMVTVPQGVGPLPEQISFPPHIVAVRIGDDFVATPDISGT